MQQCFQMSSTAGILLKNLNRVIWVIAYLFFIFHVKSKNPYKMLY